MESAQLERLVQIHEQTKELRKQQRILLNEKKELENIIKTMMNDNGLTEIKSNDEKIVISVKNVTKKRKQPFKDIIHNIEEETGLIFDEEKFVTEKTTDRLSITKKNRSN